VTGDGFPSRLCLLVHSLSTIGVRRVQVHGQKTAMVPLCRQTVQTPEVPCLCLRVESSHVYIVHFSQAVIVLQVHTAVTLQQLSFIAFIQPEPELLAAKLVVVQSQGDVVFKDIERQHVCVLAPVASIVQRHRVYSIMVGSIGGSSSMLVCTNSGVNSP